MTNRFYIPARIVQADVPLAQDSVVVELPRHNRLTLPRACLLGGWQPIETAPTTGRVWVFGGVFLEPALVDAVGDWWNSRYSENRLKPTMWQPLIVPDPPEDTQP